MGIRNYLIEGVSCTGKTSVCEELRRRGYHAVNGDTELAYQGDPETGRPTSGPAHEHHIWQVDKVRALVADEDEAVTFFCGGSRNFSRFIDLFDGVFVLEVDLDTLNRRLDRRPEDEWGGKPTERELVVRLHRTKEDVPKNGVSIDATAPLAHVVDEIVRRTEADTWPRRRYVATTRELGRKHRARAKSPGRRCRPPLRAVRGHGQG
ncbi:AAA family ATPase [Streptosporangium vulgare]|uniref:AAA family ATPase n=1 Tax=Streptosporangium vulgare TaxID=46190 RepID=A0ABV5TCH0_9ACTN